ncbi:MAG: hypothetical protein C5S45_02455 [Candidatus Methanocomedens sp.]|nr:MAG: hypothetical protein C5S45_02455 [ANME-2 cluster archaeon]
MKCNVIHNLKVLNSANIMCIILQWCFSNLAHIKSFPQRSSKSTLHLELTVSDVERIL